MNSVIHGGTTNMKRLMVLVTILILAVGLMAAPQDKKSKNKGKDDQVPPPPPVKVYIPAPVKAVMEAGLTTRETRQDIPIAIFRSYAFPAADSVHSIFLFKAKNSDLGFAPVAPQAPAVAPQPVPPAGPRVQEAQTPPTAQEAAPKLQAKLNVFLQFRAMENGAPGAIVKEVYIPLLLEEDAATYNPDQENWYSTGYPLLPGNYILSIAVTSLDLARIGTAYHEFTNPSNAGALEIPPVVLIDNNKMEILDTPETVVAVHKGFFTYSKVRVVPKTELSIVPGEKLYLFYFIFGTGENAEKKNDLEIAYEVTQDGKPAIRWAPQTADAAIVCQELPMKQTVLIKNGKEEKREQRDLPAGTYVLNIKVTDKIKGTSTDKSIEFLVK